MHPPTRPKPQETFHKGRGGGGEPTPSLVGSGEKSLEILAQLGRGRWKGEASDRQGGRGTRTNVQSLSPPPRAHKVCLYLMSTRCNLKEKSHFTRLIRMVRETITTNTGNI